MHTRLFFTTTVLATWTLLQSTVALSQKAAAPATDEYLTALYDKLHSSPMQDKFKQIAPMPFGVVFLPWAGCTEADMRRHFRMMKQLGFTNLKQTMATPEWPERETLRIAMEEGIIPFWYGEGGWEPITPALLKQLGIPEKMAMADIRKHPKMLEYQNKVLWKHWDKWKQTKREKTFDYHHEADAFLRPADISLFRQWVKDKYKTIEALTKAWNHYEVGIKEGQKPYLSWTDFDNDPLLKKAPGSDEIIPSVGREYGQVKDILRFKADMYLRNIRENLKSDFPEQPVRAGGEMGLFLPFASRATDMEGIAEEMKNTGSFYPSIHLAWHYEELDYEVARPIYMQSSLCTDWFKGGWAATWESTGGPQQFSGGKGWDVNGQAGTPGFTVNKGTMTQLLLSYLAGGFKGVGLWSWNYRNAGWESGEYALLERDNTAGERAIRAGNIAKAADKYRDEIWQARKEPYVGVFVNWDNEAIWAAVAGPGRTHFKHYPVQARVGISRALINANIPWEHVTASDIRNGLAGRYKVIYLPAQAAINDDLWPLLDAYVKNGGRLVLDAPGGWWDEQGRVLQTGKGTAFERIFGATIADFQYSNNVKFTLASHTLDGFVIHIRPGAAKVTETFQNGEPAATEHNYGKGQAVVLAPDASFSMRRQGNTFMEQWTVKHTMGSWTSPYSSSNAVVYRLASPLADHYFFINDGEPTVTRLQSTRYSYKRYTDALTGEAVDAKAIALEGYSGRWIRAEK